MCFVVGGKKLSPRALGQTATVNMTETSVNQTWEETLDAELVTAGVATPPPQGTSERSDSDAEASKQQAYAAIRNGLPLSVDVYDEQGRFLLGAGSCMTPEFLELLQRTGITNVRFRPAKEFPHDLSRHTWQPFDEELRQDIEERLAVDLQAPISIGSIPAWRRPRLPLDELKREVTRGAVVCTSAAGAVAELCESMKSGKRISAPQLRNSIDQFLNMAAVDFDLLPQIVALRTSQDEYLFDHCVNVALLSMAMGSQVGLDRNHILSLGLGGLLQDIGMLRVPASIRLAARPLSESEVQEVQRHPLYSLEMLADVRGIPQTVKYIIYQSHERMNGQGYPRGRHGRQVHELAKIVGVADAYAAMTSDREHRPAMLPYDAVKTLLYEGRENKHDRTVLRALLDTVSLFPIGSCVSLSNGSLARVLRAVPEFHTRPVVEELGSDGSPTGKILDLSQDTAIHIVATVSSSSDVVPTAVPA